MNHVSRARVNIGNYIFLILIALYGQVVMWPFSGGSKDTSKVVEELPDHLKEFFKENNPDLGTQLDETARRHRRVNDVLVRDE